jgi:hypothetical protein
MGFENVDNEESDGIAVLVIEFIEGRNLPPEWRSSVAAEYQHDRFLRGESREPDGLALVQLQ